MWDPVNERHFYYNNKDDTSAWTKPFLLRDNDLLITKYGIDEVDDVVATRRRRESAKRRANERDKSREADEVCDSAEFVALRFVLSICKPATRSPTPPIYLPIHPPTQPTLTH